MLEKILKLSEEKKAALGCIYDIRDESDRTGMRAVIELKKDTDAEKVLSYLLKYSDLQITFGVNLVAIADGQAAPALAPARHRLLHPPPQKRRDRAHPLRAGPRARRAHILEGLMVAVDNLDEVIALIRKSENPKAAKAALMERFALSDAQAQAILDMRLQRLTNLEILALRKEYEDLKKRIAELEGHPRQRKEADERDQEGAARRGRALRDERRTEIVRAGEVVEAAAKEEIIAEDALVTYSRAGLLRRVYPPRARRQAAEEGAEDAPLYRFDTQTDHTLYFFTDRGNCYPLSVAACRR